MTYQQINHKRLRNLGLALSATTIMGASGSSSRTSDTPAACFLAAVGDHARNITPDRASSIVFIVDTHAKDLGVQNYSTGTGFIVRDSGGSDGINRIVTNQHVTNNYDGSDGKDPLLIYDSLGNSIGTAKVVTAGGFHVPDGQKQAPNDYRKDWAVLKMTRFESNAAQKRYERTPGLRLARHQAIGPMAFNTTDLTANIDSGASGAPVFPKDGAVVGVVYSYVHWPIELARPDKSQLMTYGSTEHAAQSNKPLDPSTIKGSFIKSPLGIGFVAPLGDPRMLAALNQAGRGVSAKPLKLNASVTIPAFPNGYCAVYQGDVATIPPKVSSPAPQGQNNIIRPKITR